MTTLKLLNDDFDRLHDLVGLAKGAMDLTSEDVTNITDFLKKDFIDEVTNATALRALCTKEYGERLARKADWMRTDGMTFIAVGNNNSWGRGKTAEAALKVCARGRKCQAIVHMTHHTTYVSQIDGGLNWYRDYPLPSVIGFYDVTEDDKKETAYWLTQDKLGYPDVDSPDFLIYTANEEKTVEIIENQTKENPRS